MFSDSGIWSATAGRDINFAMFSGIRSAKLTYSSLSIQRTIIRQDAINSLSISQLDSIV